MKKFALRILQGCGVFALARTMSANMARILMYHNFADSGQTPSEEVTVSVARSQLEYLRQHLHVVPLSRIVEQLTSGAQLDRRAVALTIDDGRRNCYECFFPLLKEFAIPATFFVVSSFIRREDWLWTDKVLWLSEQPGHPHDLASNRIESFFGMLNVMRPEVRNDHIAKIASAMGIVIPNEPPLKYAPCSWDELREMADSGLVEIGSHTATHPILASITDEECWQELTVSRAQIEEGMKREINSFCLPNGKPGDYRPSHLRQIRKAGYSSAVVTSFGMATRGADLYQLPRMGISGRSDSLSFRKYLDGVEYYQSEFLAAFRQRRG